MAIIAGFGNPLLDITIKIEDDRLLRKHNLKVDDQAECSDIQMKSLRDDIKGFPSNRTVGGSVQNTLRVLHWLTSGQNNYRTYMIGSIGKDIEAEYIKELMAKDGVITLYSISETSPTGVTVALVWNENRSLVAYVGAATAFTTHNFQQVTENGKLIDCANLFYIEGFFIPDRQEVTTYIVEYAQLRGKLLMYNLSAPYICNENPELVKHIVDTCDILIGNIKEYNALIDIYGITCSNAIDFALKLNKCHDRKTNFKYKKIVLLTDGPNPITCIYGDGRKSVVINKNVPPEKLQDTTGAGDAFVAGFTAGLFQNYSPEKCAQYGAWAAKQIIEQIGCKIPDYSPDFK